MKKILNVISSARGEASVSLLLQTEIIARLRSRYPESTVITKNLVTSPYPHLEEAHLNAFLAPDESDSPEYKEAIRHSREAIAEIKEADMIVIGVPIYNFNLPSALKAWIDHIVLRGKTFLYENGRPEGLLKNKKVYLAIASGGVYSEGPMKPYDFADAYLRFVLGFIGLTDISTYRIEGLHIPGLKETAVQKGIESIVV